MKAVLQRVAWAVVEGLGVLACWSLGEGLGSVFPIFFTDFFYFRKGRLYKDMKCKHDKSRNKQPPIHT